MLQKIDLLQSARMFWVIICLQGLAPARIQWYYIGKHRWCIVVEPLNQQQYFNCRHISAGPMSARQQ